jgi:hypothetical protein
MADGKDYYKWMGNTDYLKQVAIYMVEACDHSGFQLTYAYSARHEKFSEVFYVLLSFKKHE